MSNDIYLSEICACVILFPTTHKYGNFARGIYAFFGLIPTTYNSKNFDHKNVNIILKVGAKSKEV